MTATNKRAWLVGKGLAKGDRGRFNKAAEDAWAAAVASGEVTEDVPAVKEVKAGSDTPGP